MRLSDVVEVRPSLVLEAADIGTWGWDCTKNVVVCDPRVRTWLGLLAEEVSLPAFMAAIHPEDREQVYQALNRAQADEAKHACDCRPLLTGPKTEHWLALETCRRLSGGYVLGVARDVSARKACQQRQESLMRELEHRMSNLFAVLSSMIGMAQRSSGTIDERLASIQLRIRALARAHAICSVRAPVPTVQLHQLLEAQLAPFEAAHRVALRGPDIFLRHDEARDFSIIAHELATNAVKYGALSAAHGSVRVQWRMKDEHLVLRWKESCPFEVRAPSRQGTGSKLLAGCTELGLGGKLSLDFQRRGLLATLYIPAERVRAARPATPRLQGAEP